MCDERKAAPEGWQAGQETPGTGSMNKQTARQRPGWKEWQGKVTRARCPRCRREILVVETYEGGRMIADPAYPCWVRKDGDQMVITERGQVLCGMQAPYISERIGIHAWLPHFGRCRR